jgi:hypothetical protein
VPDARLCTAALVSLAIASGCNAVFGVDDLSFDAADGGAGGATTTTTTSSTGGSGGHVLPPGGSGGTATGMGEAGVGGTVLVVPPELVEVGYGEEDDGSGVIATITTLVDEGSMVLLLVSARANGPVSVIDSVGPHWAPVIEQVNASNQAVVAIFEATLDEPLLPGNDILVDVGDATTHKREAVVLWAKDAVDVDAVGGSQPSAPDVLVTTTDEVSGTRSWLAAVLATGATSSSAFSMHAPFDQHHAFVNSGSSGAFFTHTAVNIDGNEAQFQAIASGKANIAAALVVLR